MPDTLPLNSPLSAQTRPRWWPLVALIMLEAAWLLWVWQGPAIQRQEQVLKTAAGLLAAFVLLLVWLLAFSRLRWKMRVGATLLLISGLALVAAFFRVSGVTGDLVPIVSLRWQPASASWAHRMEPAPAVSTATLKLMAAGLPDSFPGFPQFLGPTRDGVIHGETLARGWKAAAPKLLWRVAVGEGYSGFAIGGHRAISMEQRGDDELVVCRDLFTGVTLWEHSHPARFENSLGGIGPRTTPTVSQERVFTVGATGTLCALDLESGRVLWERNVLKDAAAKVPEWGLSGSPLVVNDLVVVHPGGRSHSLAAYHGESGEPAWAAGDSRAGYSSPQLVTLLDQPQILIFNHDGVASHAPADGAVLWTYPWTNAAQHVSDPRVIAHNSLVVSTGYGAGADLFELSRDMNGGWKTNRVWHSRRLKSKFSSLITRDGFLYGLDDGRLTCLDLANGEPRWKGQRVGHGQLLLAGDLLVVTAENGEMLLLEATPEAARELGRFPALSGKMWNPPALAPPFLIVRTEHEAACYRLPVASDAAN